VTPPVLPDAVEIVRDALRVRGYLTTIDDVEAPRVVAALAERYAFVDHERLAALEAVAGTAEDLLGTPLPVNAWPAMRPLRSALDAVSAETTSGEASR